VAWTSAIYGEKRCGNDNVVSLTGQLSRTCERSFGAFSAIYLANKQLWQIERAWRESRQILDLCPIRHRKEERVCAHVVLCWLPDLG
jgi:hypothetical protein